MGLLCVVVVLNPVAGLYTGLSAADSVALTIRLSLTSAGSGRNPKSGLPFAPAPALLKLRSVTVKLTEQPCCAAAHPAAASSSTHLRHTPERALLSKLPSNAFMLSVLCADLQEDSPRPT